MAVSGKAQCCEIVWIQGGAEDLSVLALLGYKMGRRSVELGYQAEGDMVTGELSKSVEWNSDMLQLGRFVGTLL